MKLTWEEYLQLAAVITNLTVSIRYFDNQEIEITEKNRRVAAAANKYEEFFRVSKYMKFMEEVRNSFKNLISLLKVQFTLLFYNNDLNSVRIILLIITK